MKDGGRRNIRKAVLRGVKIVALVVFVLAFLIWTLSPYVIRHYLAEALQQHGIQLDGRSSIRYNPLLSRVTVRDLNFVHRNENVFSLAHADVELHLHRLLFRDIYLHECEIRGVDLRVAIEEASINVAGFAIASQSAVNADEQGKESVGEPLPRDGETQTTHAKTKGDVFPYAVVGSLLRLSNSSITLQYQNNSYAFEIDAFSIEALKASVGEQHLAISLEGRTLSGVISLLSQIDIMGGKGEISNKLNISGVQLDHVQSLVRDQVATLSGEVNVQLKSNIRLDGEELTASLSNAGVSINQLSAQLPLVEGNNDEAVVDLRAKDYSLDVQQLDAHLTGGGLVQATGTLHTKLEGVDIVSANADQLLSLDHLSLGLISFTSGADIPSSSKVSVEQLKLSNLLASQVASDNELPPLLLVDETLVRSIRYQQEKLHIDNVAISDIRSHVFIAENKTVSTLSVLPGSEDVETVATTENSEGAESRETKTTDSESSSPTVQPQKPTFKMSLGKLHLEGENHIVFKDESVLPHYNRDLKIDAFEISQIDSESKALSPFLLQGRSNEYAKVDIAGGIMPFSESVNLRLKGDINEISLPAVSSYIRDSLGFELKSGQLDTALDVDINESELEGSVKLNLRGADMAAADDAMASMKDQGAIPLNVALGMLKDKRGNIKLSVPMSGSVNDPSFGISSFLLLVTKKAVMSQAKSYLMNTFVPYASVVSVAISAGEFALKLRFEDLVYNSGVSALEEPQVTYATQFIQLMQDKEKAQIKICGIATPAELGLPNGVEVSDEGSIDALKALAKLRSENFKRYVVEKGGIESSRLLLCNPDIDLSKKAQPRIKLGI